MASPCSLSSSPTRLVVLLLLVCAAVLGSLLVAPGLLQGGGLPEDSWNWTELPSGVVGHLGNQTPSSTRPAESSDVPLITLPPTVPPPARADVYLQGLECREQVVNFGHVKTPEECDVFTALTEECSPYFMFSTNHPDWACRCCLPRAADGGKSSEHWSVYKIQTARPAKFEGIPTLPPAAQPFHGLPVAAGQPRPTWLVREDELVVDARETAGAGGGMLILQPVLADHKSIWGRTDRPRWLRAILDTNREHARRHGHVMVLRAQPTQPQLTKWQWWQCQMRDVAGCVESNERENFNWEKHLTIATYLLSPQNFSHVLMLDADAALIRHEHNTLRQIADILEENAKSLFLTDEDWLLHGKGRINGGLMLAKNTKFTQDLFQDTFEAHLAGTAHWKTWRIGVKGFWCTSNEQICLNDLLKRESVLAANTFMASGLKYNRGAENGGETHMLDLEVEVMHWMGNSKRTAGQALCDRGRDFTGNGPQAYGCRN